MKAATFCTEYPGKVCDLHGFDFFLSICIVSAWQWIKISMKKHKQKENDRLNVRLQTHIRKRYKEKNILNFHISIFPHWILMEGKKEKASSIHGDGMEYWIFFGIVCSTQFIVSLSFTFVFVFGIWWNGWTVSNRTKCVPIHSNYWTRDKHKVRCWENYNHHKCLVYDFKRL